MLDKLVETMAAEPVLAAAVLPLGVAFVFAAVLRASAGRRAGSSAMLGALAAFLLTYMLIEGVPPLVAVTAKQKLFWLAIVGGAVGTAIASAGRAGAVERASLIALPMLGLFWLGARQWLSGPETGFAVLSVLIGLGGAAILLRLRATSSAGLGFAGGVQAVIFAAGLSIISLVAASMSLAILAGALAAGLGGVLLLDYIVCLTNGAATALGPVGRLGIVGTAIFVAAVLVLYTEGASVIAVAVLALVFVSGRIPVHLGRFGPARARIRAPLRAGLLAAIPAAMAVAIALLQAAPAGYP